MGSSASKESLRQTVNALVKGDIPADHTFWDNICSHQATNQDVFSTISVLDIEEIHTHRPNNLRILINKLIAKVHSVACQNYSSSTASQFEEAVSCVRLLTRFIPCVFQEHNFASPLFWSVEPLDHVNNTTMESKASSSTHSELDSKEHENELEQTNSGGDIEHSKDQSSSGEGSAAGRDEQPLLMSSNQYFEDSIPAQTPPAITLVNALLRLLFTTGFTIPATQSVLPEMPEELPDSFIWTSGIGVKDPRTSTTTMDMNRTDLLRCLLTCFSQALYSRPSEQEVCENNRWMDLIVAHSPFYSRALFLSLLNTACAYDPVGLGIPYNYMLFADTREPLVEVSLQILVVLLSHHAIFRMSDKQTSPSNSWISYIKEVTEISDYEFLYNALSRLLNNPIVALGTYLPNSTKRVRCHQEMLMLFWKIMVYNNGFTLYVLSQGDVTSLVSPILHFMNEGRKDEAQLGLIHLCTFVLLLLSGERQFAIALNSPMKNRPSTNVPPFTGTYADYLLLVFYNVLIDCHPRLQPLHECLLTIISNLSSYFKSLCMVSSMRLLALFERFARPQFFLRPNNYRFIYFILETLNNIVQYQYDGNHKLVYAIMRHRNGFAKLATLEFSPEVYQLFMRPRTQVSQPLGVTPNASNTDTSTKVVDPPASSNSATHYPSDPSTTAENQDATPVSDPPDVSHPSSPSSTPGTEISAHGVNGVDIVSEDDPQFVEARKWFLSWQSQLPLQTIVRMINALIPSISPLCTGGARDEEAILNYLRSSTLVGILPVPHPILIRRYQSNKATEIWFLTYMWGVIYLQNKDPPLFISTKVSLFTII